MPITGNASYIPTTDEFLAHWEDANAALPPTKPLILNVDHTAVARAGLETARTELLAQQSAVQSALNAVDVARVLLDTSKRQGLDWLRELTGLLESYYAGTGLAEARPLIPGIGEGQENFTRPLVDADDLWDRANGMTAPPGVTLPLTLADGTTADTFHTLVVELPELYRAIAKAEMTLRQARLKRDRIQTKVYAILLAYREALPPRLRLFPDLVASLPRLTPEPGHTPEPVSASAVFQAPDEAKIVYDASPDPALERYELRGNAGPEFSSDDAVVIASHEPDEPREFLTNFALTQPGAKASFAVYVILTTGNERGSAPMTVVRPG